MLFAINNLILTKIVQGFGVSLAAVIFMQMLWLVHNELVYNYVNGSQHWVITDIKESLYTFSDGLEVLWLGLRVEL